MTLEQYTFMVAGISELGGGLTHMITKPNILSLYWALHKHLTDEQIVRAMRGSGYAIDKAEELKETERPVLITTLLSSLAMVCAPLIKEEAAPATTRKSSKKPKGRI